jgi:hypothetical protein
VVDATERVLERWTVELYRNGTVAYTGTTDATGTYVIAGVTPNYQTQDRYELRFTAPGAGARTAKLGRADSPFGNGLQRIYDIVVQPGSNLLNLNLPIEPNGVIYNSMSRAPIPGATVTMVQAGSRTALPESCFDDPAQQGQVALALGYYRFDLNFADPACPTGGDFALEVVAPGSDYVPGYSQIIPPAAVDSTRPFSVPSCPASLDDAIPATSQRCEVQPSEFQPGAAIALRSAGTTYHVHLTFDDGQVPGLEPDLQQPHSSGPGARWRPRHHEDHADAQRHSRPARALHDHRAQPGGDATSRRTRGGPLSGGVPLRS